MNLGRENRVLSESYYFFLSVMQSPMTVMVIKHSGCFHVNTLRTQVDFMVYVVYTIYGELHDLIDKKEKK